MFYPEKDCRIGSKRRYIFIIIFIYTSAYKVSCMYYLAIRWVLMSAVLFIIFYGAVVQYVLAKRWFGNNFKRFFSIEIQIVLIIYLLKFDLCGWHIFLSQKRAIFNDTDLFGF